MHDKLAQLERDVLDFLLAGPDPVLAVLRDQLRLATLSEREMTGAGFYTCLNVADAAPRIAGNPSIRFGDVHAEIEGLEYGAGFVLFIDNGVLTMLEGYTYEETWPATIPNYTLSYLNGKPRDWAALRGRTGWPT